MRHRLEFYLLRLLPAALALAMLASCGYGFAGSGKLPGGVNTIAVSMLTNRTAESGLETKVTSAVIDELTRRRKGLVTDVDQADAVLSGVIDSLSTETVARSGTITAVERRLVIIASFTLQDRNGKVLWQGRQFRADQAYAVANQAFTVSEPNRIAALGEASRRLAEDVYERLTDAF